jgi:predicted metalloprotease with PDZ domain
MFTTLALQTMLVAFPAPRDREPPDKGPGFLGITFESADAEGVVITEVRSEGPAEKSGLKVNDIIRKFNGESIAFDSFAKKIIRIRPGDVVPVDVQRNGQNIVIKVKIGIRPDDFPYPLPDLEDKPMIEPGLPPPLLDLPKK